MTAMIRANSLTLGGLGPKSFSSMEKHGKRLDGSSQRRRIREAEPLVYGSLDLRDAYNRHMTGVRTNRSLKRPIMHAIIKFPLDLHINSTSEQRMLDHAVRFINQTHGGKAVFAGRLDRDEQGQHIVDVFYAPKYEKLTKNRQGKQVRTWWMSTTKHCKELCTKHRSEIENRNDQKKFTTGPRQIGIALQAELYAYLKAAGLDLTPRKPKNGPRPDRQEIEAYKATKDAEEKAFMTRAKAEQDAAAIRESAWAEGFAAGVVEASAEVHRLSGDIESLRKALWTFISKQSPLPSRKQAEELKRKASELLYKLDALAERLDDMSAPEDGYNSNPSF